MRRLAGHPASWLAMLAALAFINAYAAHGFQPVRQPDSLKYEDFDWSSTKAILSSERTPGYPAFLRAVEAISNSPRAVPTGHWLTHMLACFLFYGGIRQAGLRTSTSLFAAGTLMLSSGVLEFGPLITADSLAISLAIASAGCFFGTLGSPSRYLFWIGLALTTFATCLTRPAYLFLIPLWPILAVAANCLILRRDERLSGAVRRGLRHAAVTVLPYVIYCFVRLFIAGHFGLVSFGGYNFIGIVGQFLTEDDVPRLSEEVRPTAEEMLRRRAAFAGWESPSDFLAMERMFNHTVWDFAVPSAENIHDEDPVAINAKLSQLGKELLLLHRGEYVRWLAWNTWHGAAYIVQLTALDRGCLLLMLLLLACHLVALRRGQQAPDVRSVAPTGADRSAALRRQTFIEHHLLLWTALAFAAAGELLVVLVEVANDRYMMGAMTLLPAAIAVLAASYVRRVFPAVSKLDDRGFAGNEVH